MPQLLPPLAPPPLPQAPRPRRLLGLDPGERRTGVALSDDLGLYAHPRPAIFTATHGGVVTQVVSLVAAENVDEVVVGIPITLAGLDSAQTRTARTFVSALRAALPVPVTEWDERLSTAEAARTTTGARNRRSGALDSAAAAVVLQAVLDSRRGTARA